MIKSKPQSFLAEYGIGLSPWMLFPIPGTSLQKFLYQVSDYKYNGETVRFDYRQNLMFSTYVKEQYNDSVILNSNENAVNEYLKDKDVLAAIDSVQKITVHYLRFVRFEENKNVVICLILNNAGEVTGTKLFFPMAYEKILRFNLSI